MNKITKNKITVKKIVFLMLNGISFEIFLNNKYCLLIDLKEDIIDAFRKNTNFPIIDGFKENTNICFTLWCKKISNIGPLQLYRHLSVINNETEIINIIWTLKTEKKKDIFIFFNNYFDIAIKHNHL